jgi:hypothetical protein
MAFSIDAGTYTLKTKNREKDNTILGNSTQFIIPIYQRPYSWSEKQIRKFIADIFVSFWGYNKDNSSEPMFIGTMQLSKKDDNSEQNIIDGQQRITTFLILLKVLSIRNPNSSELKEFDFNWLITKVNNGKQQENLKELLNSTSLNIENNNNLNKYFDNALLINQILTEQIKQETENDPVFNLTNFLEHLYSKIYFVVIETQASLSKTLKIFDAINTTGLDLDAGDIFKIRIYEYLTKNGENDEVFNQISALYEKIDTKNKLANRRVTDISSILHIYQFHLIAKYKLPTTLYSVGTDRFFDRLFETLFNINKWEHFRNNVEDGKLELKLEEIDSFIDIRFEWDSKWRSGDYGNAENASILRLWWWSRYGRFWNLIFVFLHKHKDDENRYEKLYAFSNRLTKLYLLYSIYYQKSVNEMNSSFSSKLVSKIVNEDYENVIQFIEDKFSSQNEYWRTRFRNTISGNILYSSKVKNILCRLSAMLEEDYKTLDFKEIRDIRAKLFDSQIDIEHIQSYNDENKVERPKIKSEWGETLNSIGNLVVLEQKINRSINNRESEKLKGYKKSEFQIVKSKLVSEYDNWDLKKCEIRKEKEVEKIINYIFENK